VELKPDEIVAALGVGVLAVGRLPQPPTPTPATATKSKTVGKRELARHPMRRFQAMPVVAAP